MDIRTEKMMITFQGMLGIDFVDQTLLENLQYILKSTKDRLQMRLKGNEPPEYMDCIIIDVAIARYNRIGSEGMKSQDVVGETTSYSDDDFVGYDREINAYLEEIGRNRERGGFKFI